jgi:F0F1-type ATP synthase assembly protein I
MINNIITLAIVIIFFGMCVVFFCILREAGRQSRLLQRRINAYERERDLNAPLITLHSRHSE